MKVVEVSLGERSYPIHIGSGILGGLQERLLQEATGSKLLLLSNPTVYSIYGPVVERAIEGASLQRSLVLIPDGEQYKDYFWAYHILTRMLQDGLDRGSLLIALGGGVIGDIGGFVASVFMRGIAYVQVPTTLLAQVDSSVGGKTGVNHPLGKNMIGTFYQPRFVWIDVQTLRTLPEDQFRAGMAEVIKYGVIWDREFFQYLRSNHRQILGLQPESLEQVVQRCCQIKAEVVSRDEREAGLRAILNFGHTVGHAIETATSYRGYLHGEAVAVGMVAEAWLAHRLGLLSETEAGEIEETIRSYGLPVGIPKEIEVSRMLSYMTLDKKARAGRLRIVLPEGIGRVRVQEITEEGLLEETLRALQRV